MATARREDRLEGLVSEINCRGGSAVSRTADVTEPGAIQQVVSETVAESGRIDILVNNAGIMRISDITENNIEDWTAMVDVNIKGVLHFLSAVMPNMIQQGSGHIVNVGSVAGRRPFPGASVYAATKFAVRALSWGLHLELGAAHGIRLSLIHI